jgi:serine phosphatase RsbU (regulator of sigma subunit)
VSVPVPARLAVLDASGRRVVDIDAPVFRIGRGPDNHLQLGGADVSRDHAEIVASGDSYVVRDRGSRTGTLVNGERIIERRLAHGDEIVCGHGGTVLMFLAAGRPAGRRAAAGQPGELRHVATLLDALRGMGSNRVVDEVLVLVLDAAIEACGAERGFIMLADGRGALEMKQARGAGRLTLPPTGFAISRKIPERVFETGEVMVVEDLLEGDMATVHTGTVALGIRQVLCAPLRVVRYVERSAAPAARRNIGVLYLDSRERGQLLSAAARVEIEALAGEAALAIENARLYQDAAEKAKVDLELQTASRIQQALLPAPRRSGLFYEAIGSSVPSRAIGGDFFDYQLFADGAFQCGLGDVTGKGPPAALLTALVQGLLASQAFTPGSPDAVIARINQVLLGRAIESRYLSLFLGVLTPDGRLTYCNAAQNPPLLFSRGSVSRLEAGGTLVGAFEKATFTHDEVQLSDGDTIVMFSDGITEGLNVSGDEFGEEGVRRAVEPVIGEPPDRVLAALFGALAAFTIGAAQHDDMTAVVLRYRKGL